MPIALGTTKAENSIPVNQLVLIGVAWPTSAKLPHILVICHRNCELGYLVGFHLGSVTSGVTSSKTTSTGMPA